MKAPDAEELYSGRRGPGRRGDAARGRQGEDPLRLQGEHAASRPPETARVPSKARWRSPISTRRRSTDEWVNALKSGGKSRGRFEQSGAAGRGRDDRVHRAARALQGLLWDSQKMEFTNSEAATKLVRREQYRPGWDSLSHEETRMALSRREFLAASTECSGGGARGPPWSLARGRARSGCPSAARRGAHRAP